MKEKSKIEKQIENFAKKLFTLLRELSIQTSTEFDLVGRLTKIAEIKLKIDNLEARLIRELNKTKNNYAINSALEEYLKARYRIKPEEDN